MGKKFLIIAVIIISVMLTGCVKDTGPVLISVDETPTRENVSQTTTTSTPSPTPASTFTPTPEPTVVEEAYVSIEDMEIVGGDSTLYYDTWKFSGDETPMTIGLTSYQKAIGMYVKSRKITEKTGSVDFTWLLDNDYHKMTFDYGCERTLQYDTEDLYGTYSIIIYADSKEIWTSDFHDYEHAEQDVVVEIPEGTQKIMIELVQTKGIKGTLNVIMGSVKLYYLK